MFERFRSRSDSRDDYVDEGGGVATAPRRDTNGDGVVEDRPVAGAPTTRETVRDVRDRQRAEYGGLNWGAAFFGWLVAIGMAVILLAILSAAGTAFGLSDVSESDARANADTIGIVGGILLVATLVIAYYCGGYVSGRMSRFDGARQGFGTWTIGLIVTIVLAVAGAIFGSEYNILEQLNLPRIPIDEGTLTTGAAIALAAVVILTLLAAMGGGKAGERYHRKIDRLGYRD
ncbi:MAG TPA: TIGR04086 family membrane protein [Thermoleophilaceae bacterium]|nr:TIGR04086 family membrane protein [Thermoleophilaceae bacterium]